ncbi:MAG: dephospho-CoA kinase [Candidatus Cloacimonetes bacterium]|nr:dephospho-CoA kinase [Candidatus Cloacimonadota bacterium]
MTLLIGITGNIGSGKSAFCRILEQHGERVIYADEVAQKQLDKPEILQKLSERWGKDFISDGRADRQKIASIVFGNPDELAFLNSVVHPKTLQEFQGIVEECQAEHLFFEVPLLFEADLAACFDHLVIITATREIRLQRLLKRDSQSRQQIETRMDAQMDDSLKIPLCDLVVENNGNWEDLSQAAQKLISDLPNIKPKEKRAFYP